MDGPAVVASPPTDGLRRKNPTDLEDLVLELDDADLNDVDSSRDSNDFKDMKLTESPPSMETPSEKSDVPCENNVPNSSSEESSLQNINKDSVEENSLIDETKKNLDIKITELPAACESTTELLPVEVKQEEVEIKEEIKEEELCLDPTDVHMDNIDSIDKELDGLLNNDSENPVENMEIKDEDGDSILFEDEPMEDIATETVAVVEKVPDNPDNEGTCAPSIPLNGEALSSNEITPNTDQEDTSDKTDSNQVISSQTEETPEVPLSESLHKDDSMDSVRDDPCLDEIDDSNAGSEVLVENSSGPLPTSPEPAPLIVDNVKDKPSNKRRQTEMDFEKISKKIKTNSGEEIMNGLIETKKHINGFREDSLPEKKVKELEKIIRKPKEACVQTDEGYMIAREQLGALKTFQSRPLTVDGNMLEELVMMKVVEFLTIGEQNEKKLECAALMKKCRFLENALQQTQKRTQELTKQVEDAKHIIKKLVEDRVAAKKPLLPLRVTRSVGLQVCTVGSVNVVSTKQKDLESLKKLMGEASAAVSGGAGITSTPDEDKDDIIYVGETPATPKETETNQSKETRKSGEEGVVSSSKSPTSTTPSLSTAKSRTQTPVTQDKSKDTTPCIDLTDNDDVPPPTKDQQAAAKAAAISVKPPSALYSPDKLNGPVKSTPKENPSNSSNATKSSSTEVPPSKKVSFSQPVTEPVSLAELPKIPASPKYPADAVVPPKPILRIGKNTSGKSGIMLSWCFENQITPPNIEEYHLFAYQENKDHPGEEKGEHSWKKVGNIQALPLPMACFLTQFIEGHTYHFIVRAVNKDKRIGEFSLPGSISLGKDSAASAPASSTKTN